MGTNEENLLGKFRKTRLGKVPIDWNDVKLENIFEEVVEYTNDIEKYPLYSLTIESGVTPKTERYERSFLITKEKNNYKVVNKDEFVYNPMNLRFGAISRLKEDKKVSVSGYYNVFKVKSDYNPEFVEYFLKSERMMYLYNAFATGTLIEKQRVHFSQFIKFKVPLPPIKEANKIATVISTWDKAIELKSRQIEQKKEQLKGLMQKFFMGKVRLPGFDGRWQTVPIEKICSLTMGKTPSRNENKYWGKGFKWIAISDMKEKYVSSTQEEITKKAVEETGIKIIPKDTVIMSFKLTLGKIGITAEDMYSNEAIVSFTNKDSNILDNEYLYYYLSSIDITKYGSRAAKGITLNKDSLKEIIVKLPKIDEQIAIREILSTADKEIGLLKEELTLLKQQKKGLMQLLLTGKVRVQV